MGASWAAGAFLLVTLLTPSRAEAAVTVLDAWTLRLGVAPGANDYSGTSGSFTVSSGTNRLLVGGFCFETSAALTMATAEMRLDGAAGTSFTPFAHSGAISQRSHCYMGYLLGSQVTAGAHTVYVNVVNNGTGTITDIDVMSAQFQGVDQATPTAAGSYAANNSGAVTVTFGATVNYFAGGMSTYITENGNNQATITHVSGFATSGSTTANGQAVYGAVATNATAGTYAANSTVTYGGTTSTRSAIVVAALQPASSVVVPTLTSPTATAITNTTATLGANVTNNGGATLTARGTCWGTTAAPTTNCVAEGGTATGVFTQARTGLTAGTRLFYRGYATNSAGTGYSPDGSFYTEPTTQASGVSFTLVTPTTMTVSWTRGSGTGVIVLMKAAVAVDADPADGTFAGYTANAAFSSGTQVGTGNYVIFKGAGTSVPVTGLTVSTTYHVAVYEYAGEVDTVGVDQGTNYKLVPARGSQLTGPAVIPTLTSPTATAITNTTATLGANVTSNGGAPLTARGTCWGTAAAPTTNCVAEGGTATGVFTQARTGLTASTRLFYRGYATNSAGTGYSPDGSFYTEPTTQASTVSFAAVTTTTLTVNWARGSGSGVLVLMKQGAAVDADPADGTYTAYTASAGFAGGSQLGTGNYVIYKGTGTSVPVTGLAASTTYHVAVYEYAGTVDTSGVDQGTNYKLTPARGSQATTAENRTTVGTPTATVGGCNQITVSTPFTGDANGNGTTTVSRGPASTGPWTVACSGGGASPRPCVDGGVLASSTYYYQVDFIDSDGVLGVDPQVIGPYSTPACAQNSMTAGTAAAAVTGCREITVTAPYSGDANGDGTVTVEYNTANSWPGTVSCTRTESPAFSCPIVTLTPGTPYYVRVTYADPDTLSGTAVQLLPGTYTTTTPCAGNGYGPTIVPLSPARDAVVGGVDTFRVQVYDPDGLAATPPVWGIDTGSPAMTTATVNSNYSCNFTGQVSCKVYEFLVNTTSAPYNGTVPPTPGLSLANGAHYVTVKATDGGTPAAVTQSSWSFVVANAVNKAEGSGKILRRTAGSQMCIDCHNLGTHSSQATDTGYGSWAVDCLTCHTPHKTKNIYLVRESIDTPRSGRKTVAFQTSNGVSANGHATPSPTIGKNICEICHTQTKNSDGTARARNSSATDWSKHYGTNCIACHQHSGGFAATEGGGNSGCNCHDYQMKVTDAGRVDKYHHVMETDNLLTAGVTTYPTTVQPTTVTTDSDKTCVQCHADHNVFRPDRNTANTLGRGANLRSRIQNGPPASAVTITQAPGDATPAWYWKQDNAAAANYGICLSCHVSSQTKDQTNQKSDGTVGTYAVNATSFSASSHAYAVNGQFTNGASQVTVSCVKCHSDDTTRFQNGTFKFALHSNVDRRLRNPLGIATPADNLEESFCYRCHHKSTDTGTPGGGPVKTTANNDYFGAVTTMSAGSQAIYALMQKGTGGSVGGQPTTTTNTLYFKPTGQENPAEPMTNQHNTGDTFQGGTWIGRSMSPYAATTAYETKSQATNVSGTLRWRMATFTSPPVSTPTTVVAGNWTVNLYARESNSAQNAYVRLMIYRWNAADSVGTTIAAVSNEATELSTAAAPGAQRTISVAGSAVTLAAGDKLVVDLVLETRATGATSYTASYYFGQGADSNVQMPGAVTFTYTSQAQAARGRHDVAAYAGIHKPNPAEETLAYIAANRHVECEDCHSPHDATGTVHALQTNAVSGVLKNVTGVRATYGTTGFAAPTAYLYLDGLGTNGYATKEYEICFKCHSSANVSLATWNANWTNVAAEFSPANRSGHPVVTGLGSYGGSAAPKALTAVQMTASWQAVGTQTMYCSDCHGDDASTPAASGPHGSASSFFLRGPKTLWPANLGPTAANYDTTFCSNCHILGTHAPHADHSSRATCMQCHIQIPHGSMMGRLLGDANGTMPARYAYQGNKTNILMTSFQKKAPGSYAEGDCGASCDTSRHPLTTGDNW